MIGNLRHILTLQEKILTPDERGGFSESWQNVASNPVLHARLEALSGGLVNTSSQQTALRRYRITTRYRTDIAAGMRLLEGSCVYNIISALDPDGLVKVTEIIAEKTGA